MSERVELVENRFPEIIVELPRKAEADEREIANVIAFEAARTAPRLRTPLIYDSWYRTPGWMAEEVEVETVEDVHVVVAGAFISRFVEYGTEHMRAEPFLRPAAVANEHVLINKVKHTLEHL